MPVDFKIIDKSKGLFDSIADLGKVELVVGFVNAQHVNSELTVAQIAYIHEFGSPARNIPARPFFFPGIENSMEKVQTILFKCAQDAALGKRSMASIAFAYVGQEIVDSIRRKLLQGPFEPLAQITVERKGHDIPLIETGQLLESITYQVRNKR